MSKNTHTSFGNNLDKFVESQLTNGSYKNIDEVIHAGLLLLEHETNKEIALKKVIQEGIDSQIAQDFDPQKNLRKLKATRKLNG